MTELLVAPLFAGLALALVLPLVGTLLRLRDEWLATLGLAHLAAAGALLGLAIHLPGFLGALGGACVGVGAKQAVGGRGASHSAYGLMILAGWALTLLIAANTALGDALAHALIDGQLYFAGGRELALTGALLLVAWPAILRLAPRLIVARLFPATERANHLPAWRWHLGFDLLAATAIAVGTTTMGLMASFALIFLPPWLAFRLAPDWRRAQWLAAGIGAAGYGLAFALALAFDQPFGPVLVGVLLAVFVVVGLGRRPASTDFLRK